MYYSTTWGRGLDTYIFNLYPDSFKPCIIIIVIIILIITLILLCAHTSLSYLFWLHFDHCSIKAFLRYQLHLITMKKYWMELLFHSGKYILLLIFCVLSMFSFFPEDFKFHNCYLIPWVTNLLFHWAYALLYHLGLWLDPVS